MGSKRVLIVDDDEPTRVVMQLMLGREGFIVQCAPDGFKALAMAESFVPDIILLDISMPRMNGLDFAEALRKRTKPDAVCPTIIAVSVEEQYARRATEMGIDDYVVKPFYADQLLDVIARNMPD